MKSSAVKYGGIVVAIIGFFVLTILGFAYAWDVARDFPYDIADYSVYIVLGIILLAVGVLAFIFVEE